MQEGEKIPIQRSGCVGYVLCPQYGEVSNETRPISYAIETAKLPPLEPYPVQDYPQDDTIDDVEAFPPKHTSPMTEVPPGLAGLDGRSAVPAEVMNMLVSIDRNLTSTNANLTSINMNLARVAAAFEKLVSVMPNTSGDGR